MNLELAQWRLILSRRLEAVARADSMRAIREGLLWVLPCLLVSATFMVMSVLGRVFGAPESMTSLLAGLHDELDRILPMLIAASIGYMLAIRHRLPRLSVAFFCFVHVALAVYMLREQPRVASMLVLFIAIFSPLVFVPLMARMVRTPWLRLSHGALVSENIEEAVNILLPGFVTTVLLMVLLAPLSQWDGLLRWRLALELTNPDHALRSALGLTSMNSLLWFFGIHGYHALQPLFQALEDSVGWNALAMSANGIPHYPLNLGLLGCFAFLGGSGGTLSLVVAILWRSRSPGMRLLAMASLPMALLNVNELLLFGIPLILNPRMFLPFMVVPAVNVSLALYAVQSGWVNMATAHVPLNAPVVFNALASTQGDWRAVLLQGVLLLVGTLIYAPSVRGVERYQETTVLLPGLDTAFTRMREEATLYAHDPVVRVYESKARHEQVLDQVRRMAEYEFYLEYQPQVSLRTGRCTGCEALLRARDAQGRSHSPGAFLAWLSEAKLNKEVDLWVAAAGLEQYRHWSSEGFTLPISINVSGATLMSPEYCTRLLEILAPAQGAIGIELTEDALAADVPRMRTAIAQLHALGAKVAIDDFGTGYSSLSYLHAFEVDAIKIDRSFVVASATPQGAKVLDGLLCFCDGLAAGLVVEGVETPEQLAVLTALSHAYDMQVQGWYYSRALPAAELVAFERRCGREIAVT